MNAYVSTPRSDRTAARLVTGLLGHAGRAVGRGVATLLRWQELASQRHHLLQLDDRALRDLGLSRADALREASRPFWDGGGRP